MQVNVRDNNIEQALRALKKKLQREGVFREMKLKQHFEKPSVKKAREKAEAVRRARKLARKKNDQRRPFIDFELYRVKSFLIDLRNGCEDKLGNKHFVKRNQLGSLYIFTSC